MPEAKTSEERCLTESTDKSAYNIVRLQHRPPTTSSAYNVAELTNIATA